MTSARTKTKTAQIIYPSRFSNAGAGRISSLTTSRRESDMDAIPPAAAEKIFRAVAILRPSENARRSHSAAHQNIHAQEQTIILQF
jgi:hypothetical protein